VLVLLLLLLASCEERPGCVEMEEGMVLHENEGNACRRQRQDRSQVK